MSESLSHDERFKDIVRKTYKVPMVTADAFKDERWPSRISAALEKYAAPPDGWVEYRDEEGRVSAVVTATEVQLAKALWEKTSLDPQDFPIGENVRGTFHPQPPQPLKDFVTKVESL